MVKTSIRQGVFCDAAAKFYLYFYFMVIDDMKLKVVLLFCCLIYGHIGFPQENPNLVLIVADDLGWKDVGFMGSIYY